MGELRQFLGGCSGVLLGGVAESHCKILNIPGNNLGQLPGGMLGEIAQSAFKVWVNYQRVFRSIVKRVPRGIVQSPWEILSNPAFMVGRVPREVVQSPCRTLEALSASLGLVPARVLEDIVTGFMSSCPACRLSAWWVAGEAGAVLQSPFLIWVNFCGPSGAAVWRTPWGNRLEFIGVGQVLGISVGYCPGESLGKSCSDLGGVWANSLKPSW